MPSKRRSKVDEMTAIEREVALIVGDGPGISASCARLIVQQSMQAAQEHEYFAAFFQALKPGGVLGIVEHRARQVADMNVMRTTGYVTEAYVTEIAERAGFVLEAANKINANPKDTKDNPKGVWSLPPFLQSGGEAKYCAVGESDRMTLKFRKPA